MSPLDIFDVIWCAFIKLINLIIDYILDVVISAIAWAIALLPSIPIEVTPVDWGDLGNSIGYFFPIADMLTHFALMLVLMSLWYAVQHILRLFRMIR